MGMINAKDAKQIQKMFKTMKNEVKIIYFTQEHECRFCSTTRELLAEISSLGEKISLTVLDFTQDADRAKELGVDKIPGTVLMGERDYGIRLFGIPSGYEFTTLIEDIIDLGGRGPQIPRKIQKELDRIDQPVHLQVAITPTCPYCPRSVRIAHRFAMASDFIRADMLEVAEFPHLAVKYGVQGVPQTIINEEHYVVGALPEHMMINEILEAIGK